MHKCGVYKMAPKHPILHHLYIAIDYTKQHNKAIHEVDHVGVEDQNCTAVSLQDLISMSLATTAGVRGLSIYTKSGDKVLKD